MDLNFPLILMVATAITGIIALVDLLWLKKRRLQRVTSLGTSGASAVEIEAAEQESFLVENAKSFFPVLALVFVVRSFVACCFI